MNKIFNPKPETWSTILKRPTQTIGDIETTVKEIFAEVQANGNEAVAKYTSQFDGVSFATIEVSESEIEIAITLVPQDLKNAIDLAKANIEKFHSAQKTAKVEVETTEGVYCWQEKRPIQKVGLYILKVMPNLFVMI